MKKVLVALAMVMGLGSSVAFAYVVSGTQSVEQTQQNPQDEFTKVEVKDLPQAVMNVLAKDYEGAVIKEAFIPIDAHRLEMEIQGDDSVP